MMSIEPERPGNQTGGSRAGKSSGPTAGPTVRRIALGGQLRRLRESCGISREAAGDAIRGSHAKISRLELGRVSFRERDISDLLTFYGVQDPQEREQFLSLARQANEPGWWHQYGDLLPSWFETYLGLEQAAAIIRTYEAQFVPGLVQTPDYARAVINLGHGHEEAAEVDRRVALRTRRQDILTRSEPSTLWAVVDEAALRRPIGGDEVMRGQIEHLIRVTELPNVTVQVLPYSAGGHAAAGGPFSILRFPESDLPDVVYLEQLTSALYLDKRHDLDQYQAVMDKLSVQAVTPGDTPELLREIAETY
ncbi:helix-turn-helix transcriptional regulator [Saccharopolyspora halophila]|uniref:Helix-turn-helix transcriptional regulator n=1 Tax=Saccharopolyspora halophila TaxID=405551 RepID=A0ABN3GSE6_9PSEU